MGEIVLWCQVSHGFLELLVYVFFFPMGTELYTNFVPVFTLTPRKLRF